MATMAWETFKQAINVTADFERTLARLEVLSGSVGGAKTLFNDARSIAVGSSLSLGSTSRAMGTQMGFGVGVGDTTEYVKQIAEITAGDSQRFENLNLAFSQTQAAGRLMGQELLQMINAGFNPLKVISEQTGKSMKQLKKEMEEGAISSAQVAEAFKIATSEGGMFHGMSERMANSLAGDLARLRSEYEKTLYGVGGNGPARAGAQVLDMSLAGWSKMFETAPGSRMEELQRQLQDAERSKALAQSGMIESPEVTNKGFGALFVDQDALNKKYIEDLRLLIETTKEAIEVERKWGKLGTDAEAASARAQFAQETVKMNKGSLEYYQKLEELQLRIGGGNMGELSWTKQQYDDFQRLKKEAGQAQLAYESFRDTVRVAGEKERKNFYGEDDAEKIGLLIASTTGKEREAIETAVMWGQTYEEIRDLANQSAQAKADELDKLQDINKAYKDNEEAAKAAAKAKEEERKENEKLAKEIQAQVDKREKMAKDAIEKQQNDFAYRQDRLTMNDRAARVRQLQREGYLPQEARDIEQKESQNKAMDAELSFRDKMKSMVDNDPATEIARKLAEIELMRQMNPANRAIFDAEEQRIRQQAASQIPEAGAASSNAAQAMRDFMLASKNDQMQQQLVDLAASQVQILSEMQKILDQFNTNIGQVP